MTVKQDPSDLNARLNIITLKLEEIIADYLEEYAEYGWDNIAEDLTNVSAMIYAKRIMLQNAKVTKDVYR